MRWWPRRKGREQGERLGILPSWKHFRTCGISISRLAAGRVAEHWEQMDASNLLQQLTRESSIWISQVGHSR
jgi:predicted ester cyclase